MNNLSGIISKLERLSWAGKDWSDTHLRVQDLLAEQWASDRERLFQNVRGHLESLRLPTITRTAELHSWLLYDGGPFCLKLNQFKPSPAVGKASEGIHDHTRPLTSLTICGGYTQDYYHPDKLYHPGDVFGSLPSEPGETTFPGHVYTITPKIFHALNGFVDGTLTLVVYGVILKNKITVFNTVTGVVEERTTSDFAKQSMISQLTRLSQVSPSLLFKGGMSTSNFVRI